MSCLNMSPNISLIMCFYGTINYWLLWEILTHAETLKLWLRIFFSSWIFSSLIQGDWTSWFITTRNTFPDPRLILVAFPEIFPIFLLRVKIFLYPISLLEYSVAVYCSLGYEVQSSFWSSCIPEYNRTKWLHWSVIKTGVHYCWSITELSEELEGISGDHLVQPLHQGRVM